VLVLRNSRLTYFSTLRDGSFQPFWAISFVGHQARRHTSCQHLGLLRAWSETHWRNWSRRLLGTTELTNRRAVRLILAKPSGRCRIGVTGGLRQATPLHWRRTTLRTRATSSSGISKSLGDVNRRRRPWKPQCVGPSALAAEERSPAYRPAVHSERRRRNSSIAVRSGHHTSADHQIRAARLPWACRQPWSPICWAGVDIKALRPPSDGVRRPGSSSTAAAGPARQGPLQRCL